jgi:hypothetical protein
MLWVLRGVPISLQIVGRECGFEGFDYRSSLARLYATVVVTELS